MRGHTGGVLCLQVLSDYLYSGSTDTNIHCWNRIGNLVRVLNGHHASVIALTADLENNLLFSGSEDGTLTLFSF
jgi:WD40 repeat protein